MRVVATFELPTEEELCARMIDKAREVGYPLLAIEFHVDPDLMAAPADGMTFEMVAGVQIGERIAELEQEFGAMGGPMRKRGATVIPDGVEGTT